MVDGFNGPLTPESLKFVNNRIVIVWEFVIMPRLPVSLLTNPLR